MNKEKIEVCQSVITNYHHDSADDREYCNEWLEIAYNMCIHNVFPQSSIWSSLTSSIISFFENTQLQVSHQEKFNENPLEITKESCENLFQKMLFSFVSWKQNEIIITEKITQFFQSWLFLTFGFFLIIIFMIFDSKRRFGKFLWEQNKVQKADIIDQETQVNSTFNYTSDQDISYKKFIELSKITKSGEISRNSTPKTPTTTPSSIPVIKKSSNHCIKRNIECAKYGGLTRRKSMNNLTQLN